MKDNKKYLVLRVLAVLFTIHCSMLAVHAQQQIKGKVTDAKTGEAIPFASVQYKGHNVGVVSNIVSRTAKRCPASKASTR